MTRNAVLAKLPAEISRVLLRNSPTIDLPQGRILYEQDSPIEHVLFPVKGMISFVGQNVRGDLLEIAMMGKDGAVGGSAVLSDDLAYCRTTVQIAGAGILVTVRHVRDVANSAPELRKALAESEHLVMRQVVQSAVCVATHDVQSRFARWLLRCRDATASDVLPLTHEYISEMLAVRRASVSEAAISFQKKGMIRYHRGVIQILDPPAIHEISCECYETQDPPGGAGR